MPKVCERTLAAPCVAGVDETSGEEVPKGLAVSVTGTNTTRRERVWPLPTHWQRLPEGVRCFAMCTQRSCATLACLAATHAQASDLAREPQRKRSHDTCPLTSHVSQPSAQRTAINGHSQVQ